MFQDSCWSAASLCSFFVLYVAFYLSSTGIRLTTERMNTFVLLNESNVIVSDVFSLHQAQKIQRFFVPLCLFGSV